MCKLYSNHIDSFIGNTLFTYQKHLFWEKTQMKNFEYMNQLNLEQYLIVSSDIEGITYIYI